MVASARKVRRLCMIDGLYQLTPERTWSPACVPKGEPLLLQDIFKVSADFFIQNFMALFLKGCLSHWIPRESI